MRQSKFFQSRFGLLALFFAIFLAGSTITRVSLLFKSWPLLNPSVWLIMRIFSVGLFYDAVTMTYCAMPWALYLTFVPDKAFRSKWHRPILYFLFFASISLLIFDSMAEYYFFDEFGTRFNFIAVDYLIYTRELVRNMSESYPLLPLLAGTAFVSLLVLLAVRRSIHRSMEAQSRLSQRLKHGLVFLLLPLIPLLLVDSLFTQISSNSYANELSANGIYNFFAAFRNNEIDYRTFYAARNEEKVFEELRTLIRAKNNTFVGGNLFDVTREIKHLGAEKRLNVVVIVVESLSADYLGVFGNRRKLTPNLDRLAEESLFFTNIHATGTRTDRGLEAIALSVPPTPGRSIVKRPHNENMFSWGSLMKEKGYDTKFIYGGYGYFDNMNYFFSHNGFNTVDRTSFGKGEVTFENAWGVCDEDLFNKSVGEFDQSFKKGLPFFALIMTTSNHRPFTYPEGRIDIPSRHGRSGAVKYADYAIGKFIRDAKERPWFKETLFVIVADHCSSSAGKTTLPVKRYEIPLLIFSPAHVTPQRIDKLASQIDIAPTVLGLLNFSYKTKFFGKNILAMEPDEERALIGTYEKLGFMKRDELVVLNVKKAISVYRIDRNTGGAKEITKDEALADEAISYYQGADYLFHHHLNRWEP